MILPICIGMNRNFKTEAWRSGERALNAVAMLEECRIPSGLKSEFASALFCSAKWYADSWVNLVSRT